MASLSGIINAFSELSSRVDPAPFYRSVVMGMDVMVLLALIGVEINRKRSRGSKPFFTFHLFSFPLLGLIFYAYLLFITGRGGPGKEGALLHTVVLIWVLLICIWEWITQRTSVGKKS